MPDFLGLSFISSLPLPLLCGGGILLAIASNYDKQIRILSHKKRPNTNLKVEGDRSIVSQSVLSDKQDIPEAQLPKIEQDRHSSTEKSISFTIHAPQVMFDEQE